MQIEFLKSVSVNTCVMYSHIIRSAAMRRLRDVLSNKSLVESAFGQVINDFVRKVFTHYM
jgi:hypothetical protein